MKIFHSTVIGPCSCRPITCLSKKPSRYSVNHPVVKKGHTSFLIHQSTLAVVIEAIIAIAIGAFLVHHYWGASAMQLPLDVSRIKLPIAPSSQTSQLAKSVLPEATNRQTILEPGHQAPPVDHSNPSNIPGPSGVFNTSASGVAPEGYLATTDIPVFDDNPSNNSLSPSSSDEPISAGPLSAAKQILDYYTLPTLGGLASAVIWFVYSTHRGLLPSALPKDQPLTTPSFSGQHVHVWARRAQNMYASLLLPGSNG